MDANMASSKRTKLGPDRLRHPLSAARPVWSRRPTWEDVLLDHEPWKNTDEPHAYDWYSHTAVDWETEGLAE